MAEFRNCGKCNNGWLISGDDAEKCECLIKFQEDEQNKNIVANCNLPKDIENYSIEKYIGSDEEGNIPKLKIFIDKFEEKFRSIHLYCFGINATQKTTCISWLGREIAKKGNIVNYLTMQELTRFLCSEQFNEELSCLVEKYNDSDLLILDESFDKSKVSIWKSGHQLPFLDEFLRKRLERNKKSTIFISNVKIEDISLDFGLSLKSLIERNCKNTCLEFKDNVSLKNDFDIKKLWE
jgi:hypothetical protein